MDVPAAPATPLPKITKAQAALRVVDWAFAFGFLGYGIYAHDWLFGAMGVLAVGLAWYNPAGRLRNRMEKALALSAARQTARRPPSAGEPL